MKLKTEFQDEDFRKGEVADVSIATIPDGRIVARAKAKSGGEHTFYYDCIETLCNDWSDYEEPKTHWMIDTSILEPVREIAGQPYEIDKEIGNWFETKEEAELAVRKLKAWKRLKNNGFRFGKWYWDDTQGHYILEEINFVMDEYDGAEADLDLLFGGEE